LTVGGVARSLQIRADMRLASALPTVKIPASSCKGYFLTDPCPTHGEGEKNARNGEKIKFGFAFERPNNRWFNQGAGNG
jgi:hypothetical protein